MVKTLWLLCLCACCSGWAAAETRLTVKADKKALVLGEPLTVEIKAEGSREALGSIKLDKLKLDFNVYGISSNVQSYRHQGRTLRKETMTLILYPLRSGKLYLPALTYRGISSKPQAVTISEPGSPGQKMLFKTALDIERLHVRQEATLTLDIYDDGSLQWTAPREIVAAGAHQRALAASQREEIIDDKRYTVHRYAWALMPLRDGKMTVEFPLLDAFKFGTRFRYPLAALKLEVAPVPTYLPVHVPVGKPLLQVEALPPQMALGQPLNRIFSVQGSGLSKEGLEKLLPALHSNETIRYYPFSVSLADSARTASAVQTWQVTLPFVPLHSGSLQLPEIVIPYYDAEHGRVEAVVLPAASAEVFNPLWHEIWQVVAGLLLLAASLVTGYWLNEKIRQLRQRRRALCEIRNATDVAALQQALLDFAAVCGENKCRTLQQWLQGMQLNYRVSDSLYLLVHQLEAMHYGPPATGSVAELAQEAALLLRKLPLRKGLRATA